MKMIEKRKEKLNIQTRIKKKRSKQEQGITLVALIVTIIILLILAGITLKGALSENGLFQRAKYATEAYKKAEENEKPGIRNITNEMDKLFGVEVEKGELSEDKGFRYLIIEVDGFVGDADGAVINEIEIFDENLDKCEYEVLNELAYDSLTEGYPSNWNGSNRWGYDNLNDGAYAYTSNSPTGLENCTFFEGKTDSWVRFVLDLGEEVDEIGQVRVCVGGHDGLNGIESRTPGEVDVYAVRDFVEGMDEGSTYGQNVMQKNDNNLDLIGRKQFSEIITTPTWEDFVENIETNCVSAKYLLVEVDGTLFDSDGAVINEIEVYDIYDDKVEYRVLKDLVFDSKNSGVPGFWNEVNRWGFDNLNDGAYDYTDNANSGLHNCTYFESGSDTWVRFIIELSKEEYIKDLVIYVGGTDTTSPSKSRTPKEVKAFKVTDFVDGTNDGSTYTRNVKERNDDGLSLMGSRTFDQLLFEAQKVSLLNSGI